MAQGGLIGAAFGVVAGLTLAGSAASVAGPATQPMPSVSSSPSIHAATAQGSTSMRPTPLLPAVRFVPGSLLLPPPGPRPVLRDTCGAGALAWLVGQPRARIPIPTDLSHRRVSCTACVVASDVRLDRLDILYDARTNLVTRVTCG